jgi:hypothetical protein
MAFDSIVKEKRVRLIHCTEQYTDLPAGSLGAAQFIDDMGTLHLRRFPVASTLSVSPCATTMAGCSSWAVRGTAQVRHIRKTETPATATIVAIARVSKSAGHTALRYVPATAAGAS